MAAVGSGGWEIPGGDASPSPTWIEQEPGLYDAGAQLARLIRRARAHWGATVLIALVTAGLFLASRVLAAPAYPARLVLSVTEGDLEGAGQSPRTASRLRDYVANAVFNDSNLLEVMERRNLSPSLRKRNQPLAIDDFRKDIDVDVSRNHFIYERQRGDPPRSARLTIAYAAPDPRQAMLIVEDLGELVVTYEAKRRAEQIRRATVFNDKVVTELSGELASRERQLVALLARVTPEDLTPDLVLESQRTQALVTVLQQQMRDTLRAQQELDLRGSLEKQQSGLQFETVDWKGTEKPAQRTLPLIFAGIAALLLALPLCGIFVAAFGSRIHDPDDVRRLGVEPLGRVRCWPQQAIASAESTRWKKTRRA